MKVIVRKDQLDKSLKLFKRNCSNAGIVKDYRSKAFYEKPTSVNRKAKLNRIKTLRKIQALRSEI